MGAELLKFILTFAPVFLFLGDISNSFFINRLLHYEA